MSEEAVTTDGTGPRRPRFIYISDQSARTAVGESAPPATRVVWRVLAANNRALGRSRGVYSSLLDCRTAAATLRRHIDEIKSAPLFDDSVGHWSWAARLDAVDVAVCVHPFLRRVDCGRALRLFIEAVRASDPSLAELHYYGPQSLRTYCGVQVMP